ncbi:putative polyketide synthase, partial [Aureobasidium melanogenum]
MRVSTELALATSQARTDTLVPNLARSLISLQSSWAQRLEQGRQTAEGSFNIIDTVAGDRTDRSDITVAHKLLHIVQESLHEFRSPTVLRDISLADLNEASEWSQAVPTLAQEVASKRVEHNIDTLSASDLTDGRSEGSITTVEDVIFGNAVLFHDVLLFVKASNRGKEFGTTSLSQHNCCLTHTTSSSMNEHALAFGETAEIEQTISIFSGSGATLVDKQRAWPMETTTSLKFMPVALTSISTSLAESSNHHLQATIGLCKRLLIYDRVLRLLVESDVQLLVIKHSRHQEVITLENEFFIVLESRGRVGTSLRENGEDVLNHILVGRLLHTKSDNVGRSLGADRTIDTKITRLSAGSTFESVRSSAWTPDVFHTLSAIDLVAELTCLRSGASTGLAKRSHRETVELDKRLASVGRVHNEESVAQHRGEIARNTEVLHKCRHVEGVESLTPRAEYRPDDLNDLIKKSGVYNELSLVAFGHQRSGVRDNELSMSGGITCLAGLQTGEHRPIPSSDGTAASKAMPMYPAMGKTGMFKIVGPIGKRTQKIIAAALFKAVLLSKTRFVPVSVRGKLISPNVSGKPFIKHRYILHLALYSINGSQSISDGALQS